jgi:hypothetical protein
LFSAATTKLLGLAIAARVALRLAASLASATALAGAVPVEPPEANQEEDLAAMAGALLFKNLQKSQTSLSFIEPLIRRMGQS